MPVECGEKARGIQDSFAPYFKAVDSVFGEDVNCGQIHKEYREDSRGERRYSPAQIVRVIVNPIIGQPKRKHISTSYIERQNLTIRMQMRRFTRLTDAFSKKLDNLKAAVALHFFHYNFMRKHTKKENVDSKRVEALSKDIVRRLVGLGYSQAEEVISGARMILLRSKERVSITRASVT